MIPPELEAGQELYANAFVALDTERLYEGGPIPWSSIEAYAARYAFDDRQREALHDLVRALDKAISEDRAKETDKGNGDNPNRTGKGNGRTSRSH